MNAITAKGQVTIPKAIPDVLGIGPGSKVAFVMTADGEVVVRKAGADGALATAPSRRRPRARGQPVQSLPGHVEDRHNDQ